MGSTYSFECCWTWAISKCTRFFVWLSLYMQLREGPSPSGCEEDGDGYAKPSWTLICPAHQISSGTVSQSVVERVLVRQQAWHNKVSQPYIRHGRLLREWLWRCVQREWVIVARVPSNSTQDQTQPPKRKANHVQNRSRSDSPNPQPC